MEVLSALMLALIGRECLRRNIWACLSWVVGIGVGGVQGEKVGARLRAVVVGNEVEDQHAGTFRWKGWPTCAPNEG
ncbi:hypothetical protein BJ742DRAFT_827444 [Cladochytrium replicatum]|nr:hypothetical protein BJ742DRAFT_827444 [Cladochytrium replicatum]